MYVYIYIYIYIYVYVYLYIYTYIYTYIYRGGESNAHTHTHTQRRSEKLNDVRALRQRKRTRRGMRWHEASERRSRCVSKWLVGSPQLTRDWGETGGGLRVEQGRDWSGRLNPMTPRPIPLHYLEPRTMRLVHAYFSTLKRSM